MHLSYSQISMYCDCGRRWQGHYRQNLKSPAGEALVFGSTVHSVIEAFITDNNVDPVHMWIHEFDAMLAQPASKSIIWNETPDDARECGIRLFESNDVIDTLLTVKPKSLCVGDTKISMIEREVHWAIENVPDVVGYIDCIMEDGVPIDFKTAGAMWSADKASKELQPLFYLAALEQLGEHDHNFTFRHLVVTKAKTPRIAIFENKRTQAEIDFMEEVIKRAWEGISNAVFLPNPSSWLCDPAYCGAWHVCRGKQ